MIGGSGVSEASEPTIRCANDSFGKPGGVFHLLVRVFDIVFDTVA